MRSCRSALLGAALAWAAVGYGCAKIPMTHYYLLEGADDASSPAPSPEQGISIGVEKFRAVSPYDQDRIVYRVGASSAEVGFYAYHRWAAPLAEMLPRAVSGGLRGTPGVRSIEQAAADGTYDARLSGTVLAVEEIDTPEEHRARIRLELTLRARDSGTLWSGRFEGEAASRARDVGEIVDLMDRALSAALAGARASFGSALAGSTPAGS